MEFSLQILENVLLLMLLGLGYYAIQQLAPRLTQTGTALGHGFTFGLIAFLVTSTPLSLGDGATVDARAAPVILAGYVGGPVAAVMAAALGGLARGMVGGAFAFSGVMVYAAYALIGAGFWFFTRKRPKEFLNPKLIVALCIASFASAAAMFFLIEPQERALAWLQVDLPVIMIANAFGIVFASIVLGVAHGILTKEQQMTEVSNTLQLAKKAGNFGIWDFDIATGKLSWDDRSKELHGVSSQDFKGTFDDWAKAVHPDDLGRTQEVFQQAIRQSDAFDAEYRVVHKDGTQKTIKGDAIVLRNSEGQATRVVGTNLDLTEIRMAEEQLQEAQRIAVQAQKFETIGQLTGGVAHDFNNLLAVIMGNIELIGEELKRTEKDADELQSLLDASLEATRRGADLTQNLLAYARKARLDPVELDVNEVVRQTENWMRRTIPSKIKIETKLEPDLWAIRVDQTSLQNALVNLLLNARDAFSGSGQVTIETANVDVDDDFLARGGEDIAPGPYVMLSVADDGNGIDPAIVDRIFDPFFTTKGVGEGSGLGLSMTQGFVQQSGGAIRVCSEVGAGTSFKMYFPGFQRTHSAGRGPEQEPGEETVQHAPDERILLVEDREEVLHILSKTLRGAGYDVVTATSGDEGFKCFRDDGAFDLVVTDIVMPGELQGPTMAQKIRALKPDTKFIFLSGYASETSINGNGLQPGDIRLMKPVARSALLEAVQTSLSGHLPE